MSLSGPLKGISMLTVNQAVATLDEFIIFFDDHKPVGRHYPWSSEEDAELRRVWGRMAKAQAAARVSAVTRQATGDPKAGRSANAIASRAQQLGLGAYNGEPDEMCLIAAARWCNLPYSLLFDNARTGKLAATKRGKQRYVRLTDLAAWYGDYKDRLEGLLVVMGQFDYWETISKREAMALTGLAETHIARYLSAGVITAWKLPDLSQGERGDWRVSRSSAEAFVRARAEGQLKAMLDANPAYVAIRNKMTAEVRGLRHAGRLMQRDPLTTPKSLYHEGCFTIAQVASHTGLSAQVVYKAIEHGQVKAEAVIDGGRPRYALKPQEARRYATWVKTREQAAKRWHDRRHQAIAEAGLLTVRDLAARWGVSEMNVHSWTHQGLKGAKLRYRAWGRYKVFERTDVEEFEKLAGLV
jgi:hypothetical protein